MRPVYSLLLTVFVLAGCGMKGALYEPPPPAPVDDEGERKTIPATPAPGSAR